MCGFLDNSIILQGLEEKKTALSQEGRAEAAAAARKEKKAIEVAYAEKIAELDQQITIAKEAIWLTEKFGDGVYADIPGLCKIADIAEIESKGFSLTPSAYVGVPPTEDDGVDFHERMTEIHKELRSLQEESNRLMETISKNWEGMGI